MEALTKRLDAVEADLSECKSALHQVSRTKNLDLLIDVAQVFPKAAKSLQQLRSKPPPVQLRFEIGLQKLSDYENRCEELQSKMVALESCCETLSRLRSGKRYTSDGDVDTRISEIFAAVKNLTVAYNVAIDCVTAIRSAESAVPQEEADLQPVIQEYSAKRDDWVLHIEEVMQRLEEDLQTWRVFTQPSEVRGRLNLLGEELRIISNEELLLESIFGWKKRIEELKRKYPERSRSPEKGWISKWLFGREKPAESPKESKSPIERGRQECQRQVLVAEKRLSQCRSDVEKGQRILEDLPTLADVKGAADTLLASHAAAEKDNREFCALNVRFGKQLEKNTLSNDDRELLESQRQKSKSSSKAYLHCYRKYFPHLKVGFSFLIDAVLGDLTTSVHLKSGIALSDFEETNRRGPVSFLTFRSKDCLQSLAADPESVANMPEPLTPKPDQVFAVKKFDRMEDWNREVEALTAVRHPYVGSFHFCFEDGNRYYMVMPRYLCTSKEWFAAIREKAPASTRSAMLISALLRISEGLQAMHSQSLIHCDLKPDNIMFTSRDETGVPKIIDLDCCVSTEVRLGALLLQATKTMRPGADFVGGTPTYLPPEIREAVRASTLTSEMICPAVDVYCLGKTFHELVFGTPVNLPEQLRDSLRSLFAEMTKQPETRCDLVRVLSVLKTLSA